LIELFVVDVTETEQQLKLESVLKGEEISNSAKVISEDFILYHYKAGKNIVLTVKGSFEVETVCSRCGDAIYAEMEASEQFILFPDTPGNEDMDYIYGKKTIDIIPFINETMVINIPSKILCDDDCKGYCSFCRANLNENKCKCDNNNILGGK